MRSTRAGSIEIQVRDDGQGINLEKVQARAIERGLVAAGERPNDAALLELIFTPGFTTADSVSNLSGRGVGLDVVRSNLARLNGNVEVVSRRGEGTTFIMRLPLTLAILDGMSVRRRFPRSTSSRLASSLNASGRRRAG